MALHRRKNRIGPHDDIAKTTRVGGMEVDDSQPPQPDDDDGTDERDATATSGEEASAVAKVDEAAAATSSSLPSCAAQSFHVARFVMLRLIGLVYLVAFVGAYRQNIGLMGVDGLVPARRHVDNFRTTGAFDSSPLRGFLSHPSLFWLLSPPLEDWQLVVTAVIGSGLSFAVVMGLDSFFVMVALWMLDLTIVTSAEENSFYAYGWESQLLETGFLSIWLCDPPFSTSSSSSLPPSLPVLWLFRWLCARISVGAGLIKLRGGECWRNKTCLYYHFETQPIPRYDRCFLLENGYYPCHFFGLVSILRKKSWQSAFVLLPFPPEVDPAKCGRS
jgi:hypothetical protein